MIQTTSAVALNAIQDGWKGPPFDPFRLAEILGIKTVPREDINDACTVPVGKDTFQIEYNPNRPQQRIRFSIAHEISHTMFPDCGERVRFRKSGAAAHEEWELEMLCNLGAAELLMPTGNLPDFKRKRLSIDGLLELRKQFEVSAESLALRYTTTTDHPVALFVSSRQVKSSHDRYQIDYIFGSRTFPVSIGKGFLLPQNSVVSNCTAIGSTAKRSERWTSGVGPADVECVGLPPYASSPYPRVLGLMYPPVQTQKSLTNVNFVIGDATKLGGSGPQLLVHVVNDKTPNWGAGFGLAVRETWPPIQEEFRSWVSSDRLRLRLGNIFVARVTQDFFVAPMICQHGYGHSERPRIRYAALKDCLRKVATAALELKATVHMPRIGSGYAGGSWTLIEQLIDETLCRNGVSVTVYDLPGGKGTKSQPLLFS
ncbi:MAG TPA: ImmA/IrrE family metallo-endopeptidase [Verrucomicrobiae bacterium]|nr:ImmA/IrrE family metallo-endopeptidase [Verrucomicrobiae bacterium]